MAVLGGANPGEFVVVVVVVVAATCPVVCAGVLKPVLKPVLKLAWRCWVGRTPESLLVLPFQTFAVCRLPLPPLARLCAQGC